MKKQILTLSVLIALILFATMPTASSNANEGNKVLSDGYIELTLNKMERTDTVPPEFITPPHLRALPPEAGHDFVVIKLTVTHIEGRHVLYGNPINSSLLFDDKGDNYSHVLRGVTEEGLKHYEDITEVDEGSEWIFIFKMPKDREPVLLRFFYNFTESWEKVSIKEGQIEIDLQATPMPIPTLRPTLSPTPTVAPISLTPIPITHSPTATATEIPTPEEKEVSGFEVIFAIMGLLAVAYLLIRRK